MAGQQREQFPAWVRSPEQTAAHYGVSLEVGLTSEQVEEARSTYGWNELEKAPGKPLWKLVLEQFDDMLVKVSACFPLSFVSCMPGTFSRAEPRCMLAASTLLAVLQVLLLAAVVSFLLALFEEGSSEEGIRAFIEPAVILLILILNAIVGVWQESNAEAALDALKDSLSETATVLRNGALVCCMLINFA